MVLLGPKQDSPSLTFPLPVLDTSWSFPRVRGLCSLRGRPPIICPFCVWAHLQDLKMASDLLLRVCSLANGQKGWIPLQPAILRSPSQNRRVWASRRVLLLSSWHSPPKCWHQPHSCTKSETAEFQTFILSDLPGRGSRAHLALSRCGSHLLGRQQLL